ncbi:MAG: hypothetical protein QXH27_03280 [Candidatus Micrarchaeia archaeon]
MAAALLKLQRLTGWVLLLFILAYFATGYGMVREVIDPKLSLEIHTTIDLPLLATFLIHASIGARFALQRRGISGKAVDALILILALCLFSLALYIKLFRPAARLIGV